MSSLNFREGRGKAEEKRKGWRRKEKRGVERVLFVWQVDQLFLLYETLSSLIILSYLKLHVMTWHRPSIF